LALQGLRPGPLLLRPGGRRALDPVRHRAGGRCRPGDARLPARRLRRGRGAQRQGQDGEAHGAAPRPPPGAGEGRGAAAVPQPRFGPEGASSSSAGRADKDPVVAPDTGLALALYRGPLRYQAGPMSLAFLLTTLVVVATPGTGVVYTLAAGLSHGRRASVVAA